jgi:chromosome partitioning protein
MVRTIAWAQVKGGAGKTTSAINTAVCMARMKQRVLFIDADPQASATMVLARGEAPDPPSLYHVLVNTADAGDTIRKTSIAGLDLLPGDTCLADCNTALVNEVGRERRLRLAMRGVDQAYDLVVIDTSPSRSLINVNVLNYVAEVWTPVEPSIFSLAGLVKLQGDISEVVKFLDNAELRLAGLVLTQARTDNLTRDVEAQLRASFGALVCETTIPQNVKVGEAHARFTSVLDYAPRSSAAQAYEALTREIMAHGTPNRIGCAVDGSDATDRPARTDRRRRAAG